MAYTYTRNNLMLPCHSEKLSAVLTPFIASHLDDYSKLGHPYVRDYSITAEMSLKANCMEVDVTYKASVRFDYLFNAVVFNYTTRRCM